MSELNNENVNIVEISQSVSFATGLSVLAYGGQVVDVLV